jgi:general secretion pathway protein A
MAKAQPAVSPFSLSPDPAFLYLTDGLRETIGKIRYTIDQRRGLTVVYGEPGCGKSTLMRHLFGTYHAREDVSVAALLTPRYKTELQLLKAICGEFKVPIRHARMAQETEFWRFLQDEYKAGRNCAVLIDEAQMLKGEVLELVRTLLNYETNDAKLINLVLFAQPELRNSLRDPSKRALASRVFVYSTLDPLTREDTERMIQFRCERAGARVEFDDEALRLVFDVTGGVPREVLKVCDAAFLLAQMNGLERIPVEVIERATEHVRDPR